MPFQHIKAAALAGLALIGLSRRAERAATLLGAADGVRGGADSGHPDVAAVTAAARNALGQASFDRRYADGQSMPRGQAVSFAFAGLPTRLRT